jgi:hypothetical protein
MSCVMRACAAMPRIHSMNRQKEDLMPKDRYRNLRELPFDVAASPLDIDLSRFKWRLVASNFLTSSCLSLWLTASTCSPLCQPTLNSYPLFLSTLAAFSVATCGAVRSAEASPLLQSDAVRDRVPACGRRDVEFADAR